MSKKEIWDHGSSSAEPESNRNFGRAPSVGQTKPYQSGANAHGKHEKPRGNVRGGDVMPYAGPTKRGS